LAGQGHAAETWAAAPDKGQLLLSAQCLPALPANAKDFSVVYSEAAMTGQLSYRNPFVEIKLPGKSIFIERRPAGEEIPLDMNDLALFKPGPEGSSGSAASPSARPFSAFLMPHEDILPGWKPYC